MLLKFEVFEHGRHVLIDDIVLLFGVLDHIEHLSVRLFGQYDIHDFLPIPVLLLEEQEVELNVGFQFGGAVLVIEEVLQVVLYSRVVEGLLVGFPVRGAVRHRG